MPDCGGPPLKADCFTGPRANVEVATGYGSFLFSRSTTYNKEYSIISFSYQNSL